MASSAVMTTVADLVFFMVTPSFRVACFDRYILRSCSDIGKGFGTEIQLILINFSSTKSVPSLLFLKIRAVGGAPNSQVEVEGLSGVLDLPSSPQPLLEG